MTRTPRLERPLGQNPLSSGSSLAAKAHIIVQVKEIRPIGDVFAMGSDLLMIAMEKFAPFQIGRNPVELPGGPLLDVPLGGLGRRMGHNPSQQLAVSLACRHLGFESLGVDADEAQESLVQRTVVVILPVFSGHGCPGLVDHAWKDTEAAQENAGAPGRMDG